MNKKWAISFKRNILVTVGANTKQSSYPVDAYVAFRKFSTRAAARAFKKVNKYRGPMNIVNTELGMVVR